MAVDIAEVHRFIDPSLRRVTMTWDDIGVPTRLRELADETWQALDAIAADDSTKNQEWCDQLRTAYAAQYAEAEAFAHSTVVAQRRTAAAEARREAASEAPVAQRRRPGAPRGPGDGAAGRPPEAAQGAGPGAPAGQGQGGLMPDIASLERDPATTSRGRGPPASRWRPG